MAVGEDAPHAVRSKAALQVAAGRDRMRARTDRLIESKRLDGQLDRHRIGREASINNVDETASRPVSERTVSTQQTHRLTHGISRKQDHSIVLGTAQDHGERLGHG